MLNLIEKPICGRRITDLIVCVVDSLLAIMFSKSCLTGTVYCIPVNETKHMIFSKSRWFQYFLFVGLDCTQGICTRSWRYIGIDRGELVTRRTGRNGIKNYPRYQSIFIYIYNV